MWVIPHIKTQKLISSKAKFTTIGETIGNIAHQWRQPLAELSAIMTTLDAKLKFNSTISAIEMEKSLHRSDTIIKHLSQTIETFTRFFNEDAKYMSFDLYSCIQENINYFEVEMRDLGIEVNFINPNTLLTVQGSYYEFSEALRNITNNAKDAIIANQPNNPKIDIEVTVIVDNVVVSMSDNAGGIKSDNLETIFEPYVSSKGLNGMGIGLFTAKNIIEKMGGTIKAENTDDGARFTIQLPSI